MSDDAYRRANRRLWDTWARLHEAAPFYDVAAFRAGASSLNPVEVAEVGPVAGRSMLHLQCHFGLDTLSWARQGAVVTGVDFSEEAIARARALSRDLALDATFVCADVYALPTVLEARFDVVFTSYGVLPWLPDLTAWAEVVAHFLNPGGVFHLVEFHPVLTMLAEDGAGFDFPYFRTPEPVRYDVEASYAAAHPGTVRTAYEWPHGLGEVVTALVAAGLHLDYLHEHAWSPYDCFPGLEAVAPGRYVWGGREGWLPHLFSLRARKPA